MLNIKIYNKDIISIKNFFKTLGLQYCPFLIFDKNDFAVKKRINNNKIKLTIKEQEKESYANMINYKWKKETLNPELYILYINDKVGYGLFANQNFGIGDFIREYCGTVTSKREECSKYYCYDYFDDKSNIIIAPRKTGNELQFANHSEYPNVDWKTIIGNDNKYHVIFVAIKNIEKDEQILVDYGENYWKDCEHECLFII